MCKLVLIRHGESQWNLENRFTGWVDIELSVKGREEAIQCGKVLKRENYEFDIAFTSVLKRAIHTLWVILDELNFAWLPVHRSWRLNERHYGALAGLNKSETAAQHGEAQVKVWRRSFDIAPPALDINDPTHPSKDQRYAELDARILPSSESLKMTIDRVLPFWHDIIVPQLRTKKRIIIVAHGNSLRALVKYLDNISNEEIVNLNIPTAIPLVYELNNKLAPVNKYYLADPAELKKRMEAVINQGKQ